MTRNRIECSMACLVALSLAAPAALAQAVKNDKAQIRAPVASGAPPVPTRDTIRPMTKPGALLLGQPQTPGENRVYYFFRQYDQAMKGLAQTSTRYRDKLSECRARGFSPQEQLSAGCRPTDTVAACSDKLLTWCTAQARKPYDQSLAEISAAATRLSKEAAAEAENRARYLQMR